MNWRNAAEQLTKNAVDFAPHIVGALVLVVVGWILAGWVGRATTRSLGRMRVDETLGRFTGRLFRYGILLMAGLAALRFLGVETTTFTAVVAATGFAVGMAFKDTLANFSAGVMLLVFRPYKVGDVVVASGQTGKVFEIDLFSTYLDTSDNRRLIVPNGAIFNTTIENVSQHATRRVDISVGTDYAADLERTRDLLAGAAAAAKGALADPPTAAVVTSFGDSAVNWSVRVWARTTEFGDVQQAAIIAIKRALDAAGVGIPFPQMDVHLAQPADAP